MAGTASKDAIHNLLSRKTKAGRGKIFRLIRPTTRAMNPSVHILFATMTGSAEYCARAAEKAVRQLGYSVQTHNVSDVVPAELRHDPLLPLCASTYGEGEPPPDAESFFDSLRGLEAGTLAGVRYALLALGDTRYDDFCGFGKKLDQELQRLGAQLFLERVDADFDYDLPMTNWLEEVCVLLKSETASLGTTV